MLKVTSVLLGRRVRGRTVLLNGHSQSQWSLKDDLGTCRLVAVTHLTAAWTLILHINAECLTSDLEETYCLELQKSGNYGEEIYVS